MNYCYHTNKEQAEAYIDALAGVLPEGTVPLQHFRQNEDGETFDEMWAIPYPDDLEATLACRDPKAHEACFDTKERADEVIAALVNLLEPGTVATERDGKWVFAYPENFDAILASRATQAIHDAEAKVYSDYLAEAQPA